MIGRRLMKKTKTWGTLLGVALLVSITAYPQERRTQPHAMAKWVGKYPDAKFFNQPLIKKPLRRILSKADYDSIGSYNLMVPIKRIEDYLVTASTIKYSDLQEDLHLVFNLKDGAVYIIFWKEKQHRKFSTKDNQFNLPDEVLIEIGLEE
jgi:hypothetical protein